MPEIKDLSADQLAKLAKEKANEEAAEKNRVDVIRRKASDLQSRVESIKEFIWSRGRVIERTEAKIAELQVEVDACRSVESGPINRIATSEAVIMQAEKSAERLREKLVKAEANLAAFVKINGDDLL